jgi:RNA polymerase sigma factor (sigma-70 family)
MGLPAIESNGRSQDTEALYLEHGAAVARLCGSLLRDRAEAEDATQQVFLAAHRALLNGSAPREPLAWLLAVARHECYARFRQRATSPVPTGDLPDAPTPDASAPVLRAGELAVVWDEVGRMPPAQREAFLLREIRGLSYVQLAAELSLSPPSVRSLLLRARRRLRDRLRSVAAGFGGAPWIQPLVRLVSGGEGASPVPAATKAAAVGLGALTLVGGGGPARAPHHVSKAAGHTTVRHQPRAHVHQAAATRPAAVAATTGEDRRRRDARNSDVQHSRKRDSSSGESGSGEVGGSAGSGSDGSDDATPVAQPTSGGSDGSGSTSTGSGVDGSGDSSSDGGSSGSSSGPGDGSSSTTTTTTTASSGSSGSGSGDSGSGGSGSDGGGHDGGGSDGG